MNPVERLVRRVDRWQQRHAASAFTFGVIKKYGDDNGGQLVASLSHTAFVSLFPLLLVLTTILGIVAADNSALRGHVVSAVAGQFPVVSRELTRNVHQLHRASVVVLGAWVILTTVLTGFGTFGSSSLVVAVVAELLAAAANVGMYTIGFRVLTPKAIPIRQLVPGAVLAGIGWTILEAAGTQLVLHYLHSDSVYGIFAIVLSLVAWIYLVVEITIYSAEVNVVLARRLWPRSIVQPPLTPADVKALSIQPLQEQRRGEQHVSVSFAEGPDDDKRPRGETDATI